MTSRAIIWISIAVQLISICTATSNDEPLGRNYRKNFNNYQNSHSNNGKILSSSSETKISSVSYKPETSGKFSSFVDNANLKTAASEEEKFSIGLGVLSPSYSQKFGEDGKTKLDFNSEKGGFSYSLTNVVHPHQPGASSSISASSGTAATAQPTGSSAPIATNTLNKVQSEGFVPSQYYNPTASQPNPQVNIYHKQSADPAQAIYGRLASNNYPVPPSPLQPSPTPSPYSPNPALAPVQPPVNPYAAQQPAPNPYAAQQPAPNPYAAYNPYAAAALGSASPFGALSDVEKSFLQTSQIPGVAPQQIATHQHQLPQPAPSAAQQTIAHQPQSLTQPKLVAQQQLTANQNPPAIVHNANYGPYSNPYSNSSPYGNANPYGNPYAALAGLNMAASSQYPIGVEQMGAGQMGAMNYDYLNEFMY